VIDIHCIKLKRNPKLGTNRSVCRLKKWVGDTIMEMGPLCRQRWRYYADVGEVVNIIPVFKYSWLFVKS